jgi:two-component system, response regulator YesN
VIILNQNILIVDDEYEILTWLEELFLFDFDLELGVYAAGSAKEALKLLEQVRFDVVLTDIRMPGMDGIELFHQIKKNWPRCKTVFLTGYRDYDVIYSIVNHKDVSYILKSETDEVIIEAVRKALLKVKAELEQEQLRHLQEIQLEKAKYLMQKDFFEHIVLGNIKDIDFSNNLKELDININPHEPALIYLIKIDDNWDIDKQQERYYHAEYLSQIVKENASDNLSFYIHMMDYYQELIFIQPKEWSEVDWEKVYKTTLGILDYAQEIFKNTCHNTFSAVVQSTPSRIEEFPQKIRSLRQSMIGYVGGGKEVIFIEKGFINELVKEREFQVIGRIPILRSCLELRKKKAYFETLGSCLNEIISRNSKHDPLALEIYYNITIFLLQFINENHLQEQIAFKIGVYKLTKADAHENWLEAAQYLNEISNVIFSLLDINETTLTDRALKRVVKHIEEHLSEELSLTSLADIGGFNASYLSRLFKQVQKETISEFILRKRMEFARHLLADTNEKIQDIATKTGYISPHSFTRAFSNENGISPKEYRETICR